MRANRRRHPTVRVSARLAAVLVSGALVSAGAATGASASTLNTRSDHAALAAYNQYLRALNARVHVGAARDQHLITTVRNGCLGYLSPYAKQITVSAGHALGVEIGGDLAVKFTSAAAKPFRRFAAKLRALAWGPPASTVTTIGHYITAEHNLIALHPSKLCRDVIDLGGHPTYVGPGTRRFNRLLTRTTNLATRALHRFIAVLERYEARGDRRLLRSISRRAASYVSAYTSVFDADKSTLIADLGLSLSSVHARFLSLQDQHGRARARAAWAS